MFSEIAAPLINLTKKGVEWRWEHEESKAFEALKEIFASEPILAQWNPERHMILEADSSGYAIGGCLSQIDERGQIRPVAYFSKRLNSAEANYPIHDKEMHSIVACLQEWKPELVSVARPFTIISDHKNLEYLTTKRLLNERQVRYNDVLQQFRYKFEWRPGHSCERPDTLSGRDKAKPTNFCDERKIGRIMQLLPSVRAYPAIQSLTSMRNLRMNLSTQDLGPTW